MNQLVVAGVSTVLSASACSPRDEAAVHGGLYGDALSGDSSLTAQVPHREERLRLLAESRPLGGREACGVSQKTRRRC